MNPSEIDTPDDDDDDSDEPNQRSRLGGAWAVYEVIDSAPAGQFYDPRHPLVQESGRELLRAALATSAKTDQSLDALWDTFRSFVRSHEYSEAIAREIKRIRSRLSVSVEQDYLAELRADALAKITREVRDLVHAELREKFMHELAPAVQAEVRERLSRDYTPVIQSRIASELRSDLTLTIRAEVKASLLEDSALRAEVVAELKRRVLDL